MPDSTFQRFAGVFREAFRPPRPYTGDNDDDWLVSRVWSDYVRDWLQREFRAEVGALPAGRSNAALWFQDSTQPGPDVALAWMWDNNKVWRSFAASAFEALFLVRATAVVGLVQTRVDGTRGNEQAIESLHRIRSTYARHAGAVRSAGVIEIRRVAQRIDGVSFACFAHDFAAERVDRLNTLEFS